VILSTTPCGLLPAAAQARLGARSDQTNVLIRVVLRDLERTLTDDEGNALRDRIYGAIHRGTEFRWAATGPGPERRT